MSSRVFTSKWLRFAQVSAPLLALFLFVLSAPQQEAGAQQARRVIKLPTANPQLPFSDGILVGNTLYLSGKIGIDPKTGKPPEDPEAEARLMIDGIKATLEMAGMTMDDLVTATVYCSDLTLYDKFNGVYRSYFTKEFPARAFIASPPLLRGGRFELQAIAVKR
jgi:reactive intermediate/imine deaminase